MSCESRRVRYMIYACLNEGAALPINKFLDTKMAYDTTVCGDAFVFRIEVNADRTDKPGRANYIDMNGDREREDLAPGFRAIEVLRGRSDELRKEKKRSAYFAMMAHGLWLDGV